MSQKIKNILLQVLPVTLLATLFVAAVIYAWTEPKKAPPQDNVDAPLNVGPIGQAKQGNLMLNASGTLAYGLLVPFGNVGIGDTTPTAKLVIKADDNTGGGNELQICKNGVCCPIWKDCDGDGKTYGNGDCDESCKDCYVGSTAMTAMPDKKDQDCNGVLDEKYEVVILNSATNNSCSSICNNNHGICKSVGIDTAGTDGQKAFNYFGHGCITMACMCEEALYNHGGGVCWGYQTSWTNCRCSGYH